MEALTLATVNAATRRFDLRDCVGARVGACFGAGFGAGVDEIGIGNWNWPDGPTNPVAVSVVFLDLMTILAGIPPFGIDPSVYSTNNLLKRPPQLEQPPTF